MVLACWVYVLSFCTVRSEGAGPYVHASYILRAALLSCSADRRASIELVVHAIPIRAGPFPLRTGRCQRQSRWYAMRRGVWRCVKTTPPRSRTGRAPVLIESIYAFGVWLVGPHRSTHSSRAGAGYRDIDRIMNVRSRDSTVQPDFVFMCMYDAEMELRTLSECSNIWLGRRTDASVACSRPTARPQH